VLSLHNDGLTIVWQDRTKDHLARMAMTLDGLVDLDRAAMIAPRGMAKILVASLDSYAGDKEIDELIAHKDDLLKLVDEYTSDGKFKADTKKDDKALSVTVRLKGKSISDVVPVALMVPGAMMFLGMREKHDEVMEAQPAHTTSGSGTATHKTTDKAGDKGKSSDKLKPMPKQK
jgi:hypothetical protein